MEWLAYVIASLFTVLGAGCMVLVAVGLPGTWILLALALAVELTDGYWIEGGGETFGWWLLGGCVALTLVGEGLELLSGAAGTKAGGGSKRGMGGAVMGGLLGAILLTPLIPVPVVGTLLGALIGTFVGALLGERSRKEREDAENIKTDLKAATGATFGRLLGLVAKVAIGISVWIGLSAAAFWP